MQIPLELAFRDVRRTEEMEKLIRRRVDRLEKFASRIIGCRIAVERPHKRADTSGPWRVRVDVTVPPNRQIIADKQSDDRDGDATLVTVVHEAFEAAERQVKELAERQQGEVKTHDEPRAFVVRLFADQGYGFLKTENGREIYFHENAVTNDDFARLAVGTQVRFAETMGEKGAQASTVQIVGKPGERVGGSGATESMMPPAWGTSGTTEDDEHSGQG